MQFVIEYKSPKLAVKSLNFL